MEGGKGVVGIRDLFRWVGDGRESSSGQKGGGTKDLAVLELLFPGPWVTGGGRDERPRRSPFELRYFPYKADHNWESWPSFGEVAVNHLPC